MKGIAHFAVGVGVVSCFPVAVAASSDGNPLYFILGGMFGLLPDTLDFKFARYFYAHNVRVTPDPLNNDPAVIAGAVASAMDTASDTGRAVRIKLDTIQLGSDKWQEYSVCFDVKHRCVTAAYGPVVDTGGEALLHGEGKAVSVPLLCGVRIDYLATVTVGAFDGPVIEMRPINDRAVVPLFIPWHRRWSHSALAACLLGSLASVVWGAVAGLSVVLAYGLHVLLDQCGFMGSCLWFPLRRDRIPGLGIMHSGSVVGNTAVVWGACLVVFWNLSRIPELQFLDLNLLKLGFWGMVVPFFVVRLLNRHLHA